MSVVASVNSLASTLASVYPGAYVDLGLTVPYASVRGMRTALHEAMHLAPITKVLLSTDAQRTPETFWLAARAYGLGVGWVSILDSGAIAAALDVPQAWTFIAYLCVGFPLEEHLIPELERVGWQRREPHPVLRR